MNKEYEISFSLSVQIKNLDIQEQVLLNELLEKNMKTLRGIYKKIKKNALWLFILLGN